MGKNMSKADKEAAEIRAKKAAAAKAETERVRENGATTYEQILLLPGARVIPAHFELKHISEILQAGEGVKAVLSCWDKKSKKNCTIAVTNKRILLVHKLLLAQRTQQQEIQLNHINSISYDNKFGVKELIICYSITSLRFERTSLYAEYFVKAVNKAIEEYTESVNVKSEEAEPQSAASGSSSISAADEILKFKQLADSGIITQAEFEKKKQQLLNM